MIRAILSNLAETSPGGWLRYVAEFAAVSIIVAAIVLLAVGLAPDLKP